MKKAKKNEEREEIKKNEELEVPKVPHRIPYDVWVNSQLSIARHYGGCKLNGKSYVMDFKGCRKEVMDGVEKYFPDLVEVVSHGKKTKRG